MTRRGSAVNNKLTSEEYERILEMAASIKDEKKSIESFFYHLGAGYLRMRPGTLSHYHETWYDPERKVIEVPSYHDCDCGDCRKYARQQAESDSEDRDQEEILEEYWNGKEDATARDIPLKTRRQVETVELFNEHFGHFEKPAGSYMTIWRRMTRIVELTPGLDPSTYKPYVNRASAVTHFAWAGMSDTGLINNFGWARPQTIERYRARSGQIAATEMDKMYGRTPETDFQLDGDPPMWSEYRPDDPDDLIEVDTWTPEKGSSPTLPPEDEEEALKRMTLDDFLTSDDDSDPVKAIAGPMALGSVANWNVKLTLVRATREIRAMQYDDEIADPTTSSGMARYLLSAGALTLLVAGLYHIYPAWLVVAMMLVVWAVTSYRIDMEEPPLPAAGA